MAMSKTAAQIHKRTPATCPRCEARLKQHLYVTGEPVFIHPARVDKDGSYVSALMRCMYAGTILSLDQLRQLHRDGFLPISTDQLATIIHPDKRLTRDQLDEISKAKSVERVNRQASDIDTIVNAWYARSYNYLLDRKNHVLH